ncbi:MAG: hypothetical protein IH961_06060 [Chloroflexi bacterium]|nr:hypothetical protein [Chloroflexota bacterium]
MDVVPTYEHNEIDQFLVDVEGDFDPYISFLPVINPGCSIEEGLAYLETVEVQD